MEFRYKYHQSIYMLPELIDWFNNTAPRDDVSLHLQEMTDAISKRVTKDDMKSSFMNAEQIVVTMPYRLRYVGRHINVKIFCRFLKMSTPFSPNINFVGYLSIGMSDEMDDFIANNKENMRDHYIIELPSSNN